MKKSTLIKSAAAVISAAAISVTALAGCAASSAGSSKALDASFSYAKDKLTSFVDTQGIRSSEFADKAFFAAEAASLLVNEKSTQEELQRAARVLSLDSIVIADAEGTVVNCYPEDNKGKKIKETDHIYFNRIIKNIAEKCMTDPEKVGDSNVYNIKAGVKRAEGGEISVGYTTDEYEKVTGAAVAGECGVNTVVFSGDTVLGSTLEGAKAGATMEDLGVKTDDFSKDSFEVTVDGKKYDCKGAVVDEYAVLTAVAK